MTGYLKTAEVRGSAGLFLREDARRGSLALDAGGQRVLKATNDRAPFSVSLGIDPAAESIAAGAYVSGTGTLWIAGLRLLADGQPVDSLPKAERPPDPASQDHEFDNGSRIVVSSLTPVQQANLFTLGKVCGIWPRCTTIPQ